MSKMLWRSSEESIRQSNMHRFMQLVNARHRQKFDEYTHLYRWSVEHIAEFWAAMWEFAGVIHSATYSEVADDLTKMPGTHWFPGARLNFAENLLRYRDDRTALIINPCLSPTELLQNINREFGISVDPPHNCSGQCC